MPNTTDPQYWIGDDHNLQARDHQVEVRNVLKDQRDLAPEVIVIHYTAGASARSSADSLADPDVKASAHLVIGRDGELIQVTPFNKVAWHAGRSEYTFADGQVRKGFNSFSIGIEIDNPGPLTPALDGHRTWFGREVPPSEVIQAVHRNQSTPGFWHAYTQEQIATVQSTCRALIAHYRIKHILGHEEISPQRKTDPGPAFPLDKLRHNLLGANRRDETEIDLYPRSGAVTASRLNVRSGASGSNPRVAMPLEQGAPVTVLREQGGWYYVRAHIEGWVDGRHVDLDRG